MKKTKSKKEEFIEDMAHFGMTTHDIIVEEMAADISKEIDKEFMNIMLKNANIEASLDLDKNV